MEREDAKKLELNKILSSCAEFATLPGGRDEILASNPAVDVTEAERRLDFTAECYDLLFFGGCGKIEAFGDVLPLVDMARKGATLSCRDLRVVSGLLTSARTASESIRAAVSDAPVCRVIASRIVFDERLEADIREKIIADDAVSDDASEALYDIRSKIRVLNDRIRSHLAEYVSGKDAEYLQESIVTTRGGRFVVPVKAEHKSHVRGFVHDRSDSGATFFIEPEHVLELNNELVALELDEKEEIERILSRLSARVAKMSEALFSDVEILNTLDAGFARADYSYSVKGTRPRINGEGRIDIISGRHPLIDKKNVVPVSLSLGADYRFLILSGANTGGKTVTLKMCGLFCLMSACGLFVPADEGTEIGIFENVFCDLGDAQSIEESLSTFSSHMTRITEICDKVTRNSLILLDELGGGTNPDEGQAIAKAVLEYLINAGAEGMITTHFTPLKEFAYTADGVENASMEFDLTTLRPLYRMKTGLPGASNAFAICKRIGLRGEILKAAEGYLSEGTRSYENIMRRAEEAEVEARRVLEDTEKKRQDLDRTLKENKALTEKLNLEREKIQKNAKSESRRIIAEKTSEAEEMVKEIEEIFKKDEISQSDLIRARTLKNKLERSPAGDETEETVTVEKFVPATLNTVKAGDRVFVPSADCEAVVSALFLQKEEVEVMIGSVKLRCKVSDVGLVSRVKEKKDKVSVVKSVISEPANLETNVIGMNVEEALSEVDAFIDRAVMAGLEEIKVIHGVGKGILRSAIAKHLQKHKNVASYRLGKYGEGETGVTIITLKK
ncbi:MAG: endonuclease MutS2 [Clostridia bacterium]|nr:endonuclease MutS2 [Clostridia bacterium]